MAVSRAYRAMVAGRVLLAVFGGYALAAVTTALLSLVLPLERAEAVTTAMMLGFVVMPLAALYVFAARSLPRAALGIGLPLAVLGAGLWLALSVLRLGSPA